MKKIVELIIGNSEQSNPDAATIQLPVLEVMIGVLPNEDVVQLPVWVVVIGMLPNEEGDEPPAVVDVPFADYRYLQSQNFSKSLQAIRTLYRSMPESTYDTL